MEFCFRAVDRAEVVVEFKGTKTAAVTVEPGDAAEREPQPDPDLPALSCEGMCTGG